MHYTPDEVAELLANRPNQPHYIAALIAKCVAAERERVLGWCAKVQAHHQTKSKNDDDVEQAFVDGEACGAEDCIEAIRADGVWP